MGQQRNQQYNNNRRNNGSNNRRVDPEREARMQEAFDRKKQDLIIIDLVCGYLDGRVNEVFNIRYNGGDVMPKEYEMNTKDIIAYLEKEGINIEDTKRVSQFTSIISDLAKAQLDNRLDDVSIFIRSIYVQERINAWFAGNRYVDLVTEFHDTVAKCCNLFGHKAYVIAVDNGEDMATEPDCNPETDEE